MWAWFITTKIGRWIVGFGAVIAGMFWLALLMFWKGRRSQAGKDQAKRADDAVKQAQAAQDTYQAATEAAGKVRKDADKKAPPDPDKRNDFDSTF
jgi:type VI protein secretion system component VasK